MAVGRYGNLKGDADGGTERRETVELHARLASTRRRFDEARRRTAEFLAGTDAYVAWSGGKDSTVVAVLATEVDPAIPLCHYDSGFDFPEVIEHQERLAAERGWDLRRYRCGDALAEMVRTGGWDHEAEDATVDGGDSEWLWVTRLGPAQMAAEDTGAAGHLWGLRASEAKRRHALLARTRGVHTRADGWRWCSPIWDWSDRDVYAFHLAYEVPLSGLYERFRELGAPLGAWRTSLIIDPGGLARGRAGWLRRGWPDLWSRACEALPRLREFG